MNYVEKIITKDYNIYGGDFQRYLSLRRSPDGKSLMICLQTHHREIGIAITDNPKYIKWLLTQENLLLSYENESWFNEESDAISHYDKFREIMHLIQIKALEEDNISIWDAL